jgi:hypothetical protein
LFEQFIQRVHRRLVFMRILERIGIGILVASACGAILIPILMWRGQPAMTLAMFAIALGAIAGFVWGATQRPTMLQSAMEADRQLGLSDLLGTAITTTDTSDGWARTVRAMAEARCATILPSAVIVNRLGARAWGGIGLSAALVVTLGLISITATREATLATTMQQNAEVARVPDSRGTIGRERQSVRSGETARTNAQSSQHTDLATSTDDLANGTRLPGAGQSTASSNDAAGAGIGQSRVTPQQTDSSRAVAGSNASPSDASTDAASGSGAAGIAENPNSTEIATGSTARTDTTAPNAPPWTSPEWPSAQSAAMESVRSGRLPATYHDLVRAYFDRASDRQSE